MKQKILVSLFGVMISVVFLVSGCKFTVQEKENAKFTITYSTTKGIAPVPKIVNSGYKLTEDDLISISAENCIFEGWYIGETKIYSGYTVTASVTLTAKWTDAPIPAIKKIKYVLNGGAFKDINLFPTEYKAGDYISFHNAHENMIHPDGYWFGGFFSDKNYTKYVDSFSAYEFPWGVTLYAKWYLSRAACSPTAITENSITVDFTIPSDIQTQLDYVEMICKNATTKEKKSVLLYDIAVGQKISHTFTNLDNTESYYLDAIIHDKNGIESSESYDEPVTCANPGYSLLRESYPYEDFSINLPDHVYLDKDQLGKTIRISACDQTHYYTDRLIFKSKDKVTWERCSSDYVVEDGTTYFLAFATNDMAFSFSKICEVTCSDKYDSIGKIYYTDGTYSAELNGSKTIAGIVVDCDMNNTPSRIMSINTQKCVFNSNPNHSSVTYDVKFNGTDGENNWELFKTLDDESNFTAYNFINNIGTASLKWYMPSAAELLSVILNKDRIKQGYITASSSLNFSIWASNATDSWDIWIANERSLNDNARCYSECYAYGFAKIH